MLVSHGFLLSGNAAGDERSDHAHDCWTTNAIKVISSSEAHDASGEGFRSWALRYSSSSSKFAPTPPAAAPLDTDSIRNPAVSSGAAAGGADANLKEEEEGHFSPHDREPSPEASSASG